MAKPWEQDAVVDPGTAPQQNAKPWEADAVVSGGGDEPAAPKTATDHAADMLGPFTAGPFIGAQLYGAKKLGLIDNQEASGIARKIRSTMSFGLDDEAVGGIASLGGNGEEALAAERRSLKDYEAAHPAQALAVGVGSSLATLPMAAAAMPARAAQAFNQLGRVKQATLTGGGLGAAYGFGEGEGVQDRLIGSGTGLVTGGALGAATVPIANTIGKVANAVSQPLKAYLMPTKVANEKLLEALSRDQGGKATLQAAGKTATKTLMSDADTMVADLGGENTQGLIKQAMRMPNAQREVFKTKLDARQARQVAELTDYLGKKLGTPETFDARIEKIITQKRTAVGPIFERAWQRPAVVSPENKAKMASLLSTPTGTKLMERAVRFAQDEQQRLQDMSSTRIIHIVKMQADDILNGLKNRREGLGAWDFHRVAKFKRQLLDLVENDTYKLALKSYAGQARLQAAAERGFRHGFREDVGTIAKAMQEMAPAERDLYRLGLGKWLITKLRSGNVMNDRIRREFMDKNFMDKMRYALGGKAWKQTQRLIPNEYRKLQQYVGVKGRQSDTRRFLQSGSDTARNLMEMENASQAAQNMTMLAKGVVDPSKIMDFLGRQHSRLTGMTPGVANALLKRAGQQANKARYSSTLGPRTQDDIDRALTALQAGKPLNEIKSKYREIVKALIALEGYSAGSWQQP